MSCYPSNKHPCLNSVLFLLAVILLIPLRLIPHAYPRRIFHAHLRALCASLHGGFCS
jgi:hypothetical protein